MLAPHSLTDHTQGNWNGIIGDIELRNTAGVWINNSDVQVYPDVQKTARVLVVVKKRKAPFAERSVQVPEVLTAVVHTVQPVSTPFETEMIQPIQDIINGSCYCHDRIRYSCGMNSIPLCRYKPYVTLQTNRKRN